MKIYQIFILLSFFLIGFSCQKDDSDMIVSESIDLSTIDIEERGLNQCCHLGDPCQISGTYDSNAFGGTLTIYGINDCDGNGVDITIFPSSTNASFSASFDAKDGDIYAVFNSSSTSKFAQISLTYSFSCNVPQSGTNLTLKNDNDGTSSGRGEEKKIGIYDQCTPDTPGPPNG